MGTFFGEVLVRKQTEFLTTVTTQIRQRDFQPNVNYVVNLPQLLCGTDRMEDPHLGFNFLFWSCQGDLGHAFRLRSSPK